jgi:very-short-patch-repair endonuclease
VRIDERIARLASRQLGLVSHGQLRRVGLGQGAIRRRREAGRIHLVFPGVYAVGHTALAEEAQLLARVMACGSEAALSHDHAAHLWRILPSWEQVDLTLVDVTVAPGSRRGRRPGIIVHRSSLEPVDRTRRRGIPVTGPARTILDLAAGSDPRRLERAIDHAITDELLDPPMLSAVLERYPATRGSGALRSMLTSTDRRSTVTASKLEERFLKLVRDAGLPPPALNARIGRMRVDATWAEHRVAVELDGYRWHRTRARQESDRRREAALRSLGYTPLRYSAAQVFDQPLVVVADLVAALAVRRA